MVLFGTDGGTCVVVICTFEKYIIHLEHPLWREDILLVPQHCDVQALLVGKVVQLPLLVVDERAGVGQPKLLSVSFGSGDKLIQRLANSTIGCVFSVTSIILFSSWHNL